MTLKRWLRTFGIRTAKILFAFSLLLSCISLGAGDPDSQLRSLQGHTPEEQLSILEDLGDKGQLDPQVATKVMSIDTHLQNYIDNNRPVPKQWLAHQMQDVINLLKSLQSISHASAPTNTVDLAKKIKSSPVYRDPGPKQTTNWLANAVNRLGNMEQMNCQCKQPNISTPDAPHVGSWFIYAIYIVLISALAGFIIFAVSRFSWSRRLHRKAKALLDDDEPERTLDEWLEMADKLETEGRYREAVRCLYLACLLKIDEARIARFERSQTNWEHLQRIEASPARPSDLQFREPTRAFDIIWYGMRVNGSDDVMRFRVWYREITQLLRSREAA